jgi:hypothetical protein
MIAISIVLILLYFGNNIIFKYWYDTTNCDGFVQFYANRNIVYEIMFFLFCLVGFYNTKGVAKSLLCFLFVMIGGSIVDKALFKITYYVYTDIILGIIAFSTSYIIYNHGRRMEGN